MSDCNIAPRRSVAVFCMMYEAPPLHRVNDLVPVPYVAVQVTCGTLVKPRYT